MDPFAPSHDSPHQVGDEVAVTGTLTVTNASGGSHMMKHANIRCRVTKSFWDYETGWSYHGTPVEKSDLDSIRAQAGTAYGPDWYRANRPEDKIGLARAEQALKEFNPAKVFFSEHDVSPVPAATPGV